MSLVSDGGALACHVRNSRQKRLFRGFEKLRFFFLRTHSHLKCNVADFSSGSDKRDFAFIVLDYHESGVRKNSHRSGKATERRLENSLQHSQATKLSGLEKTYTGSRHDQPDCHKKMESFTGAVHNWYLHFRTNTSLRTRADRKAGGGGSRLPASIV
jgi:hypothetical protein